MEVVEEKARLEHRSFGPEPAKLSDPDCKGLGRDSKTSGLFENTQENGARVSTDKKEAFSGDLNGGFGDRVKKKVDDTEASNGNRRVRSEDPDASGVEAESLEDSEMNGVSSLLKMRQDFGEKDNGVPFNVENQRQRLDVKEGSDLSETMAREEKGDIDDADHKFRVGDFVWGKIKSHPWWPGQIYDSSDASDLALKIKQKGRLLVAYFGDGTFAWCHPSQLKPFEENFKELSSISSSRSFVYAVEDAVEEIGKQVELVICSSVVSEEHLSGISRPFAENAGIKDGVLAPKIRKYTVSGLKFEPQEILDEIKNAAKVLTLRDLLDYEMLKRKVSAFYRAKLGYQLPEYQGPYPIPGLEDESTERAIKLCSFKGSSEADSPNSVKSHQRSLEKCSGFPEDRLYHRRKQKSIAEILEADTNSQAKGEGWMAKGDIISARKKRKGNDEVEGDTGTTVTSTSPLGRKISEISSIEDFGAKEKVESPKGNPLFRKRKIPSPIMENDGEEHKSEEHKSERQSAADTVEGNEKKKDSFLENSDDTSPLSSLRRKIKIDVSSIGKNNNGEPKQETPNDSLTRQRKKSKYLSPPYMSEFSWKAKKSEIEAESLRVSSQARVGEPMTNAPGCLIETSQETSSKESGGACEISVADGLSPRRPRDDQSKAIDPSQASKLVTLIREVALSPQYAKENRTNEVIGEFMSMYRSLIYLDGPKDNHDKAELLGKHKNQAVNSQKEESKKPVDPKPSEEAEGSCAKTSKTETEKQKIIEGDNQDSEAELFITFGPGSSLPSKDDLVRIYDKFGPLNKERTDMIYDNFCARVVFVKTSDAEEAFNSSQNRSPFVTPSTISFRLKNLYASSMAPNNKGSGIKERTNKKKPGQASASKPSRDAESSLQVDYIKAKLEEMRSMVEKSGGRISAELKSKLEAEMKKLLEKLSNIAVSSS